MGKSENIRNILIIEENLRHNRDTYSEDFKRLLSQDDGKKFCEALLTFLYAEIDNLIEEDSIKYIVKGLLYIEELVEIYPELDINKIKKKLRKIAEKTERVRQEKRKKFENKKKIVNNRIKEILELIDFLVEKVDMKESKYYEMMTNNYELLNCFIEDEKPIEYIEKILKTIPDSIKSKNKKGESIIYTVCHKYINELKESKNKNNVYYYRNIIYLLRSQKEFSLCEREKRELLKTIYHQIKCDNFKNCSSIRNRLEELKNIIIEQNNDKNIINAIAKYYNIGIEFKKEVLDELKVHQANGYYSDRKIIDEYMVTIDSSGTKEIDDGLTAKILANGNYLLGVHIASVLSYFPYESKVIEEAISRGSTIYLSKNGIHNRANDDVIPIFPKEFAFNKGSLIENNYRLANSYFFEIDKDGNVVNEKYEKTIVRSNQNCTYKKANNILEFGSKKDTELEATLNLLLEISVALKGKNKSSELYRILKTRGNDPAKILFGDTPAENMLQSIITLTGSQVASWFKDKSRDYPCLLRVHEIDPECNSKLQETIKNLNLNEDKESFDKIYSALSNIYPKPYYDIEGRHDGLDLEHYCHITSPLRRSADILQEYALDICYFNNPSDKELANLESLLIKNKLMINAQNNTIDYFLNECRCRKKIKYK